MAEWKPLAPAQFKGDVAHFWEDDGEGGGIIHSVQDTAPILERNKALYNEGDGYNADRTMRRVGFIPNIVLEQWRQEGWDPFDPANAAKLAQKLNSNEYLYLRTAPGHLGVSNGGKTFR